MRPTRAGTVRDRSLPSMALTEEGSMKIKVTFDEVVSLFKGVSIKY